MPDPQVVLAPQPRAMPRAAGRKMRRRSPSGRTCPECGSEKVYRSHRRGIVEKAARLPGLAFQRCHGCGFRFGTLGSSSLHLKDIEAVFRKGLFGTVAVAAALMVLTAVLWLAGRQANFSLD